MKSAVIPASPGHSVDVGVRVVATPVLEWASAGEKRSGSVMMVARNVCYVRLSDAVVALGMSDAPTLPNEVSLGKDVARLPGGFGSAVCVGDPARLHVRGIDVGRLRARWPSGSARWEPRATAGMWSRERVRARGEAILRHLGLERTASPAAVADVLARYGIVVAHDDVCRSAITRLLSSIYRRDPQDARRAAAGLVGLGAGLTPEGDDLLAAAAASVVVLGPSVGLDPDSVSQLAEALTTAPAGRTTALSGTLLGLARVGRACQPVGRLLDLDAEPDAAIERLSTFGHTTGRMYLTAVGATAVALAAG